MPLDCDLSYAQICGQNFIPREHQRIVWNKLTEDIPGFCLLSGTGSGKTEAVMIPSLVLDKRLVMVYPTRSLVDDQIDRAKKYIRRFLKAKMADKKTLIIDVGGVEDAYAYRLFGEGSIELIANQFRFWSSTRTFKGVCINENDVKIAYFSRKTELQEVLTKIKNLTAIRKSFEIVLSVGPKMTINIFDIDDGRFLVLKTRKHYYGGDIILTTLDKFLYRFFGYGEKKWNLLYPYRFLVNPKKSVIAFDEAHVYNDVAYTNFIRLVSSLIINPKITVAIMSATLPIEFTEHLKSKFKFLPIPGAEYKGDKTYEVHKIDDATARTNKMLEIISQNPNNKIIVVRNTTKNAFNLYKKLVKNDPLEEKNGEFKGVPIYFYHGRLFDFVKSSRYKKIKEIDRTNSPYILITTHAIEVGCDLNSNIMLTDFCNPDQLIQRSGRCAREKGSSGVLHIVGTKLLKDDQFLKENLVNYQHFTDILNSNISKFLPEEKIRNETIKYKLTEDKITDALFRLIYSYVYNFDRTKENLHESGILVTRSWEPSANTVLLRKNADLEKVREIVNKRQMAVEELLNFLVDQKWSYSVNPLKISLRSLCKREDSNEDINLKTLQLDTFVVGVDDSRTTNNRKGYVTGKISAYTNDLYVFYRPHEPSNTNLIRFGLISLPKIFDLKTVDTIKKRVLIKKQFMSDNYKNWKDDIKID
jgi:CRISPR-associated endonuclease/helicase Cas3